MNGIAPASQLLIAKVTNGRKVDPDKVAEAITWCVDEGAHVINVSMVARQPHLPIRQAIRHANEHGVAIVCAAANEDGQISVGKNGAGSECIVVAAMDYQQQIAMGAASSSSSEISAPGSDLLSCYPRQHRYALGTGSSMACAVVTGYLAVLQGYFLTKVHRLLPPNQLEAVLRLLVSQAEHQGRFP